MAKKKQGGGGTAKKAASGTKQTQVGKKAQPKSGPGPFYNGMDLGDWASRASAKQKRRMNERIEKGLKGYVPAGGNTAPPPSYEPTPTPTAPPTGPSADEISLFERTITSILRQYGLATPNMVGFLRGLYVNDQISDSPGEAELMGYLYDQPDFRARFPSIAAQADKQKNDGSVRVWSPAEVMAYEDTLRGALSSYGVDGYDVKTTTSNLILGDVSANEAAMRVSLAAYAATTGPREVAEALMQHEGIGPGDLVSFYLNPDRAQKEIERKHATAQMQAWQKQQGLSQDWGFSEQVVAQEISNDQAQAAFAQAAMQKNLTSGYGETSTEQQTKTAALGMSSDAEKAVRRSLSGRQGNFNKSGGAAESQTGVSGLRTSR